ncbi:hypothetical protein K0C01_02580 [Salinarchaeum sp. IM2453]|nr:hypothetical protein [Salinarchaeum sp. IM2453]QZA89066.1 hypothetical protein K0C01_02580 [Salinarchaeum sp. IM2453]
MGGLGELPCLVERVDSLPCIPVFLYSECCHFRDDTIIQHVAFEGIDTMFQNRAELASVVWVENQLVVLQTRIDPFVETLSVFDLVTDTDCTDVCVYFPPLACPQETSEQFVVVELVDIVQDDYEVIYVKPVEEFPNDISVIICGNPKAQDFVSFNFVCELASY